MLISGLFDTALMVQMHEEGYLRWQDHPSARLRILNYTEKAQFERCWNEVTRQCRGLIYDLDTCEVVARPFPKFFNYGEDDVHRRVSNEAHTNQPVTVTDKLDGSLGILYHDGDDWAIATRGSFQSVQAMHATRVLRAKYADWEPHLGVTYLFEIIYPQNRIVCNYGDTDDLMLLGMVHIEQGWSTGPFGIAGTWPGPKVKVFDHRTFKEAIEMPPRPGAEGVVVHFPNLDYRVKLKQADYVILHRVITGLNERAVWEMMRAGKSVEDICADIPDDFHAWVEDTGAQLLRELDALAWECDQNYRSIVQVLNNQFNHVWTRRDFAALALKHNNHHLLFKRLDNKPYGDEMWKMIKPEFSKGPWSSNEDTA